ncbi:MAG TPA: phospho-sugar mutase [Clostridia bacterium]|nr:phospho-sugar mutase [Clostridia bacterium]
MNEVKKLYKLWLEKTDENKEVYDELLSIKGKDEEILDRFYRNLEFGTAGLRGVLGAGTNRMNVYTVNQATQGLADYINSEFTNPSVAIAFDSRINSDVFSKEAAQVFAANGIKVYIYRELVPTPMLSFAVRELKCSSGIIVTASHNPAKYNGYKCYDPEGYQMTDEAAKKAYDFISKVDIFGSVKKVDFYEAVKSGRIEYIPEEIIEKFYSKVLEQQINPGICQKSDLKVIFTPLNGAGNKPVRNVLEKIGLENVSVVPEQEMPDGNFPTCPYPNPEIRQAFEYALKMTEKEKADILLATDPDCDRVGIAVYEKGEYELLSGNEVGVLLAQYILSSKKADGTMPENPVLLKSFVTTSLVTEVAKKYGCEVVNLLTGFKYIGEFITNFEKKGEADRFIIGMEESYGYLSGIHARDKDAVVASMLICEMAAYYKKQGKTLVDVISDVYNEYGYYLNSVLNFAFEGASGMKKMKDIMQTLRENAPCEIAGEKVLSVSDYYKSVTIDTQNGKETAIHLPSSNVLEYKLPRGSKVIVRPSGTEPKIKAYISAVAENKEEAVAIAEAMGSDMKKIMGLS